MTDIFFTPSGLRAASEPGAELDREILTDTLFRCIGECTSHDEVQGLREQVVAINMGVADSLARRFFGRGEINEDLRQVAYLGLIKSVAGFDRDRGRNFLSYAVPTITGELKKHFRDRCWSVRPPRRVQDLQREITAILDSMRQESHRKPTVEELAEELDVPAEQVTEALAAQGCFSPSSLDAQLKGDSATTFVEMIPADDREFERCEAHMLLVPLIKDLPDTDREILKLRFFEEWTQQQIAQELGTSQMEISRRLSRLMIHLRHRLENRRHCA